MTTQCKYSPDDQVEFAYGEMNPKKAEAFRAHLESCPACRVLEIGPARISPLDRGRSLGRALPAAW